MWRHCSYSNKYSEKTTVNDGGLVQKSSKKKDCRTESDGNICTNVNFGTSGILAPTTDDSSMDVKIAQKKVASKRLR